MKKLPSVKRVSLALLFIALIQFSFFKLQHVTVLSLNSNFTTIGNLFFEAVMLKGQRQSVIDERLAKVDVNTNGIIKQEIELVSLKASSPEIVYDGMTMEQLAAKLDKSLSSTLEGYGHSFAKYSIEYGVDPYLAVAITLHETGCTWTCSNLVRSCNNVGGMRGQGCNGWAAFESLDAGIEAMIRNLSRNYIQKGLTTPETIGPKYAMSQTWAGKINNYMNKIKNV